MQPVDDRMVSAYPTLPYPSAHRVQPGLLPGGLVQPHGAPGEVICDREGAVEYGNAPRRWVTGVPAQRHTG